MKVLDLFCGDGGAAVGLHRAFPDAAIIGVDIEDHSVGYPFTFVQADAMEFPLEGYDLIWASPPCQGYSVMRHLPWNAHKTYPLLIAPTLERLRAQPAPFILENVMGARSALPNALWLCGTMFGKRFYRHRLFETSFAWFQPLHPTHIATIRPGHSLAGRARDIVFIGAQNTARAEMDLPNMSAKGLSQAIPPCFSQYLCQFVPVRS